MHQALIGGIKLTGETLAQIKPDKALLILIQNKLNSAPLIIGFILKLPAKNSPTWKKDKVLLQVLRTQTI